jgi:hypothetical protein
MVRAHRPYRRKVRPARIDGDVAYLTLTQDKVTVVDVADLWLVGDSNWSANEKPGGIWYARRSIWHPASATTRNEFLHRALVRVPPGYVIDHIDGDGLNNRRSNLRVCTHTQNLQNSRSRANPFGKGVFLGNRRGTYKAVITVNGRIIQLGHFPTIPEAKAAYDAAALEHFGEFARLA